MLVSTLHTFYTDSHVQSTGNLTGYPTSVIIIMQAALGRTLVASGGTILVLGGATMVVSTVSMGVTKIVIDRSKVIKNLSESVSREILYIEQA